MSKLDLLILPSFCPLRDTKNKFFAILPWESCALYRGVSIAEGGEISAIPWRCLDSQKGTHPGGTETKPLFDDDRFFE